MSNQENNSWVSVNEPLAAVQNLINGCLIAQSKGAFSFEESSILWESVRYLVSLQVQLRESNGDMNAVLKEELAKPDTKPEVENATTSE